MLTTNESVIRCCDGGLYPECNFCTFNKYPEKKVAKGRKGYHRPPLIVIDDNGPKNPVDGLKNAIDRALSIALDLYYGSINKEEERGD
jgi:hypothetical protein